MFRGGMVSTQGYKRGRTGANLRAAKRRMVRQVGYVPPTVGGLARAGMLTRMRVPNEVKYYDTSASGTIAGEGLTSPTGLMVDPTTVNCISAPAQGNAATQRDGQVIILTSMHISGIIRRIPQGGTGTLPFPSQVRLWVVLDTQSNAAQMNSQDCFINPLSIDHTIASPLKNLTFGSRFKILATRTWQTPGNTYQQAAGPLYYEAGAQFSFDIIKKKLRIPVRFNGSSAGVASVVDNSIHVIAAHNDANIANLHQIYYNARVRFVG